MSTATETLMYRDVDLTELKVPKANHELPKKPGALIVTDVGTYLNWVITGQLRPYPNNRGNGRISKKTSESVRAHVHEDALGQATIGPWEGILSQNDWHSRTYGLLWRLLDGELTAAEMNYPIAVKRIREEFMVGYKTLNDGALHSTQDKIKNPDLVYGDVLKRITAPLSDDCVHMVGENKWTVLSSIMFAISDGLTPESEDWDHTTVYARRGPAMKLANDLPKESEIKPSRIKPWESSFSAGIQYWYELMMVFKSDAGKLNIGQIQRSAGFFGFIVVSKMGDGNGTVSLPARNGTLAARILKNFEIIAKICPQLCRGDRADVIKHCRILKDKLGIRPNPR